MDRKTTLERAYELAEAGYSTAEIRTVILREGYDLQQVYGRTISVALNKRIRAAKEQKLKRESRA